MIWICYKLPWSATKTPASARSLGFAGNSAAEQEAFAGDNEASQTRRPPLYVIGGTSSLRPVGPVWSLEPARASAAVISIKHAECLPPALILLEGLWWHCHCGHLQVLWLQMILPMSHKDRRVTILFRGVEAGRPSGCCNCSPSCTSSAFCCFPFVQAKCC